jgi:predicted metal-dependent peptidase
MSDAAKRLGQARARLVLAHDARGAFFAPLALRLRLVEDATCPTMATDGEYLIYNPAFVLALKTEELIAVVCHETLHCAYSHFLRREMREPERFNVAADCAINCILRDWGFKLPEGCAYPEMFKLDPGHSMEWYYSRLPKQLPQGWNVGACRDGGAKARKLAKDWQEAAIRACEEARRRGTLPGALEAFVGELLKPVVTWPEFLRNFILTKIKERPVWCPPNKRFVHTGLYVPSMRGEDIGNLILMFDTSGSMGKDELLRAFSEVAGITEQYSCTLTAIFHDVDVYHVTTWASSDGPLPDMPQLRRGGTSHVAPFKAAEDVDEPTAIIAFTDLETCFPDEAPDVPVLWAHVGGGKARVPWGEVIDVDLAEVRE